MKSLTDRREPAQSLRQLAYLAWIAFLIFLPVTSFRYFPPALGGGALVRPLSVFPLLLLLLLVTLPRLLFRRLPRTLLTLLPFVACAVLSSLLAFLRGTDPTLGVSVGERFVRSLFTLAIGGSMYLTVALFPRTRADLEDTLRWLYLGFSAALLWGALQAVYVINYSEKYYIWINRLQRAFSIRKLITTRISGMTYEPNWFAQQISFLLIPWLLAAVMTDRTVFRWRRKRITIEWMLLVLSLLVLVFTFSRAGLAVVIVLVSAALAVIRPAQSNGEGGKRAARPNLKRRAVEVGAVLAVFVGFVFLAGARNQFFSRVWSYWSDPNRTNFAGYLEYLGFGPRFIYSETAFQVYQAFPLLGVGLGNYAFYFDELMPDRQLSKIPEILQLVTIEPGQNRLITPKNLYVRLLAETGLVGTAAFLAFVVAVLGCALFLWLSKDPQAQYWGLAGLYGVVAFSISAFSFDSFVIPNMWVVFGLTTAASWIFWREQAGEPSDIRSIDANLDPA